MGKSNIEQLRIAEKYIDQGGAIFRKYCGMKSGPYCNALISFIFKEAENKYLYCKGRKETYCPHSIKWCFKNLASIPPYLALPSDVIYFDWNLNGDPNHVGFVRKRKSCDAIYTLEGNTDKVDEAGNVLAHGVVAYRTRSTKYVQAIFRPHFKATFELGELEIDGLCGYNTIAMLQKALKAKGLYKGDVDGILGQGTVKGIQKLCKASPVDGLWGKGTSKALQKFLGVKVDGYFGPDSVKALQEWINLEPWFTAMREQYDWSKNQEYDWTEPTVETSRKKGTCISFIAVSLQRIGLIPKGSYFYCDPKKKKITGKAAELVKKSKKFKLWYPGKTVYELWKAGEIKIGDIVSYADPNYHTMEFDGMENGEPRFNTMGGGKRGLHVVYPYYAKRKVDMLVRIVKVR